MNHKLFPISLALLLRKRREKEKKTETIVTNDSYDVVRMNFG